jgi:hypothetical protein
MKKDKPKLHNPFKKINELIKNPPPVDPNKKKKDCGCFK